MKEARHKRQCIKVPNREIHWDRKLITGSLELRRMEGQEWDENVLKLIAVIVAHICKCIIVNTIGLYSGSVNSLACELYLNNIREVWTLCWKKFNHCVSGDAGTYVLVLLSLSLILLVIFTFLLAFSSSFIFINSFCHWLSEYLLSICSVPGITLGAGDKRSPWADTSSFFPMETTLCCQGADSEQVRRKWRQRDLRRKAVWLFIWCPW